MRDYSIFHLYFLKNDQFIVNLLSNYLIIIEIVSVVLKKEVQRFPRTTQFAGGDCLLASRNLFCQKQRNFQQISGSISGKWFAFSWGFSAITLSSFVIAVRSRPLSSRLATPKPPNIELPTF